MALAERNGIALFAHRILKGERPADIAVELPKGLQQQASRVIA